MLPEQKEETVDFIIGRVRIKKILDGRVFICECLDCDRKFIRNKDSIKDKRHSGCPCFNKRNKYFGYLKGRKFYNITCRSRLKKIPLDVTFEDLNNLYIKQKFRCYYTGIALDEMNASLDRLNSNLGYTIDNVVWCCADINWIKWEYPLDEFLYLCRKISEYNQKELPDFSI